ncbi:M23 family metallopeptidase [Aquibacillus albus]|uniref:Murein DD-endopeptidase MepM/ murein hydrolase activator NlpD n=1 Tax=Aquibacillus albus TaxID=1168171 RepID=A0ABS2N3B8_9BACI|nr:M23 family metallopeptidase [Aquibacillus albus]MBM7572543.1 murein DD-endopeptidase MepM/ murein hydrolase activator NlpD [Aquibacillus albus]
MWKNEMDVWFNKKHPQLGANKIDFIKKTVISTMVGVGLTFSVAYANEIQLSTVYHVYVDGEHVGTADDKEAIESYVSEIVQQYEQKHDEYAYTIDQELTYVEEKVFNPNVKNQQIYNLLDDELSVKVNAIELKVGDKVLGYFKDKETAEAAINQYKLKYVDEKTLENLEKNESNSNRQAELDLGDSRIIDVSLSEKVSLSTEKVSSKNIISKEEALTLLEKGTLEDKIHTVRQGEVLGKIASMYNLDLDTILQLNPSITEDSLLQIGQEINVTDYEPFIDVIVKKEELVEEEIPYEEEVVSTDELYKGDTKVKQQGSKGMKEVYYSTEIVNGIEKTKEIKDEKVIKDPVKRKVLKGTKVIPSRGTGDFGWPAVGGRITSYVGQRWGSYHKGIDIAGVSNRAILAADNGIVESAGWDGGYGKKVVINHQNGYKTIYAHLSSISVSPGQTVRKGKSIGTMGSTGHSTGTHLHFEVYKNGSLINPTSLY